MEPRERCQSQIETSLGKGHSPASIATLRVPEVPSKTYRGTYGADGGAEVWVEVSAPPGTSNEVSNSTYPLPLCLEVRDHSPTGFAWGYGGSGPAQLALALLLDATGDKQLALRNYQELKREFVSGWGRSWSITAKEIVAFVARQEALASPLFR